MSRNRYPTPSDRPFRSVESRLTLDDRLAVEESAAAELRGDWATAFDRHRAVAMFGESLHGAHLRVLADLDDAAPGWLVDRFVVSMAHRLESFGQLRRSGRVLQTIVPLIHPHGIPFAAMGCEHVQQVGAHVLARDWVVRQADVYDLGGLADLLHLPAAAGAVARAARVAEWRDAPVGGYRVVGADGDVLVVADAVTGFETELLDLGATALLEAGTSLLARIVPTDAAPGRLFDARPLPVDETTARAVAAHPGRWLRILAARATSRALPEAFSHLSDSSIHTDLPQHAWGSLLGHRIDEHLPRHPASLAAEALETALRLAGDDGAYRHRHVLAELLLDEVLDDHLVARFARPAHRTAWQALAEVVAPHARLRCEQALWLIEACPTEEVAS